jgi:hypothetical protein
MLRLHPCARNLHRLALPADRQAQHASFTPCAVGAVEQTCLIICTSLTGCWDAKSRCARPPESLFHGVRLNISPLIGHSDIFLRLIDCLQRHMQKFRL